jgi:hypothetical protein
MDSIKNLAIARSYTETTVRTDKKEVFFDRVAENVTLYSDRTVSISVSMDLNRPPSATSKPAKRSHSAAMAMFISTKSIEIIVELGNRRESKKA